MKLALIMMLALTGCGSDSSSSSTESAPAGINGGKEVVRIEFKEFCYSDADCTVRVIGMSNESGDNVLDIVVALSQTETVPACRADNTVSLGFFQFQDFKPMTPGETYNFRACTFDKVANTYSPGITRAIVPNAHAKTN